MKASTRRDIFIRQQDIYSREVARKNNKKPIFIQFDNVSRKIESRANPSSIKRICKFLKHPELADDLITMLKSKYPDAANLRTDNKLFWIFDEDSLFDEIKHISDLADALENEGIETFDRLYYWASKEA